MNCCGNSKTETFNHCRYVQNSRNVPKTLTSATANFWGCYWKNHRNLLGFRFRTTRLGTVGKPGSKSYPMSSWDCDPFFPWSRSPEVVVILKEKAHPQKIPAILRNSSKLTRFLGVKPDILGVLLSYAVEVMLVTYPCQQWKKPWLFRNYRDEILPSYIGIIYTMNTNEPLSIPVAICRDNLYILYIHIIHTKLWHNPNILRLRYRKHIYWTISSFRFFLVMKHSQEIVHHVEVDKEPGKKRSVSNQRCFFVLDLDLFRSHGWLVEIESGCHPVVFSVTGDWWWPWYCWWFRNPARKPPDMYETLQIIGYLPYV